MEYNNNQDPVREIVSRLNTGQWTDLVDKCVKGMRVTVRTLGRTSDLEERRLAKAMNEAYFNLHQILTAGTRERPVYTRRNGGVMLKDD